MDVSSPLLAPTIADFKAAVLPDLLAAMPQPATAAPPAVALNSATGSAGASSGFARADHTHQSRLQARTLSLTFDANGEAVYIFPLPYDVGVTPIVEATAHNTRGAAYRYDASILAGSVSNTAVTIVISKTARALTIAQITAGLPIFTNPADTLTVSIMSRAPS